MMSNNLELLERFTNAIMEDRLFEFIDCIEQGVDVNKNSLDRIKPIQCTAVIPRPNLFRIFLKNRKKLNLDINTRAFGRNHIVCYAQLHYSLYPQMLLDLLDILDELQLLDWEITNLLGFLHDNDKNLYKKYRDILVKKEPYNG